MKLICKMLLRLKYPANGISIQNAAIKSTKHHMKHMTGSQIFTYEELSRFISRIEGILNSRPLTILSLDPYDLCALTPGHFLEGNLLCRYQNITTSKRLQIV